MTDLLTLMERKRPAGQAAAILADLEAGHQMTPLDALRRHGCFRLAARIAELRAAGYPIATEHLTTDAGARVASYRLQS